MGFSEWFKRLIDNSREKHKLSFTDDTTYQEKWSFRLSAFNLFSVIAFYTILIATGIILLVKFTPVQYFVVDTPPTASVRQINQNSEMLDSLSSQIESRQRYLNDLKKILTNESFEDSMTRNMSDSLFGNYQANFTKSQEDSLLRLKMESQGKVENNINYDFFYAPLRGTVSQSFNLSKGHLGVDIVAEEDSPIKSCLEGTVIYTAWTSTDGEVVIVQHKNNFITVYKHCSSVLKSVGDKVQTADPIAIIGNTGKHTSGPHLHFEIWQNGKVLDPQELINFSK